MRLAGQLERQIVHVPDLGDVMVQELDAGARASIEAAMMSPEHREQWKLMLLAFSIVDPETMERPFDLADLDQIARLPARIVDPIFTAAFRLSRMGADAVEEAEKN
jgi:hypothetical protein